MKTLRPIHPSQLFLSAVIVKQGPFVMKRAMTLDCGHDILHMVCHDIDKITDLPMRLRRDSVAQVNQFF